VTKKSSQNNHLLKLIPRIDFKNQTLLKTALTHRSYLNEHKNENLSSNERLEFLGDTVLEFLTSKFLYENFPSLPEGQLTNIRSNIVCTSSLAAVAKKFNLGEHLLLSRGEKESGGQNNKTLLANVLEAVIGAIYLDQGLAKTEKFIFAILLKDAQKDLKKISSKDYKSLLQEKTQAIFKQSPNYQVLKEVGPDHNKTFTVGVFFLDRIQGRGVGKSKQDAEQKAAQATLEALGQT
jgi:ribonuclease-3